RIANPEQGKPVATALLAGRPVALVEEACRADWLRVGAVERATDGDQRVVVTDRATTAENALVFHPPVLALGIGCERGCAAEEIARLAEDTPAGAGPPPAAVAAVG